MPHRAALVHPDREPRFTLQVPSGRLTLDDEPLAPTALFLRRDVFAHQADRRPEVQRRADGWYDCLVAYARLNPQVFLHNRGYLGRVSSKAHVLALAAAHRLPIPDTRLSNDMQLLAAHAVDHIIKPVAGGSLTRRVSEMLPKTDGAQGAAPCPALLQPELVAPERRVYLVGDRCFAYTVRSEHLDYRGDDDSTVHPAPPLSPELERGLRGLAGQLGLDLTAADFKSCARTGELKFLEINSQPMWQAFDVVDEGAIARAILDDLLRHASTAGHKSVTPCPPERPAG